MAFFCLPTTSLSQSSRAHIFKLKTPLCEPSKDQLSARNYLQLKGENNAVKIDHVDGAEDLMIKADRLDGICVTINWVNTRNRASSSRVPPWDRNYTCGVTQNEPPEFCSRGSVLENVLLTSLNRS